MPITAHAARRGGLGQVNSAGRDVAEYNLERKRTSSTSSAGLPKRRAADTYPCYASWPGPSWLAAVLHSEGLELLVQRQLFCQCLAHLGIVVEQMKSCGCSAFNASQGHVRQRASSDVRSPLHRRFASAAVRLGPNPYEAGNEQKSDNGAYAHKDTAYACGRPSPAGSKEANLTLPVRRTSPPSFTNVGRGSVPPLTGQRLGVSI